MRKSIGLKESVAKLINIGNLSMSLFDDPKFPYITCVFNASNMTFESISANTVHILGYEPYEIENNSLDTFLYSDKEVEASIEVVKKNAEDQVNPYNFRNIYLTKDGKTKVYMEWASSKMQDNRSFSIGRVIKKVPIK